VERELAVWLVNYHNGKVIRQFQQVLQIPLQEIRIVTTCVECGGTGGNCCFCDGRGTVWLIAPE
jgi:prepilin-type processing-associated H-X9-DG protein